MHSRQLAECECGDYCDQCDDAVVALADLAEEIERLVARSDRGG